MQSTPTNRSPSKRCFDWLKKVLNERENPSSAFKKTFRRLRLGLTLATVACFIFLVAIICLLKGWGERHWILSIALFLPAILWLVPFILLTPLHLIFRPKLCWISLAALLVVGFGYLDFHWTFSQRENETGLTLLSNNVGGRSFETLAAFMEKQQPDVVALQDSWLIAHRIPEYPASYVSKVGEYSLLSKFPIRHAEAFWKLAYRGRPIAARFELDYHDQTIVIYSVHMPTPRLEFAKLRGRGFLREMIGRQGIYSADVRKEYQKFVQQKLELASQLIEILQKEKRPFLVAGDFNMPSNGYAWGLFSSKLTDAFNVKGRGYGFTFPGQIREMTNIFGSWLRIDYLFADKKNWRVDWCRTEPRSEAEHSAVLGRFALNPN